MVQQFKSWAYIWGKLIQKDTGTLMLIATLFTEVRTQQKPECPSVNEWIKKMWYIYTVDCYTAIKK